MIFINNTKIKCKRNLLGLTQLQISKIVGINKNYYQNIEYGKQIPNVITGCKIGKALHIDKINDLENLFKN